MCGQKKKKKNTAVPGGKPVGHGVLRHPRSVKPDHYIRLKIQVKELPYSVTSIKVKHSGNTVMISERINLFRVHSARFAGSNIYVF